ncbi:MAG: ABC transporter ATP-binding protein, partial [Lachnospiraceae bacterium]|nr:ABC transporter ATP-binding protein [Lachnospiraceae bacterium]
MIENLKKLFKYYKPYKKLFIADTVFAIIASAITLIIPLIVRYVTSKVIYLEPDQVKKQLILIAIAVTVLVLIQCYANFFISNYGHVMGASIEYDMRAEIFAHYQKLSFSFFDDEKVGQLMSRITSDLFEISELLHHGPENLVICFIKIIGAMVILTMISPVLTVAAFVLIPIMIVYAYFFNKRMKRAFKQNRVKIAAINEQIEDNLSGIRVVKSFANEEVEEEKF